MSTSDMHMWLEAEGFASQQKAHTAQQAMFGADRDTKTRARTVSTISTEPRSDTSEASLHESEHFADGKQDSLAGSALTTSSVFGRSCSVSSDTVATYAKLLSAALGDKPTRVENTRLAEIQFDDHAWRTEWRTALQLRGLLPQMCHPAWLTGFLEAHGLRNALASVHISGLGVAVVVAESVWQAREIAALFHRRTFPGTCVPVEVTFATDEEMIDAARRASASGEPQRLPLPHKIRDLGRVMRQAPNGTIGERAQKIPTAKTDDESLALRLPLPQYFPFIPCSSFN